MIIPALLLALSASAHASFEAEVAAVERGTLPSPDELAGRMREGTREERLAAVISGANRIGGLDFLGQRIVVSALREQAESFTAPGEVRGKAVLVLGEQVAWMKDDSLKREAVEVLLTILDSVPGDNREPYRRHALMGLRPAAGRLPRDERLEDRAGGALLTAADSADGVERTLALLGLDELARSRPRVLSSARLGRRAETVILDRMSRERGSYPSGRSVDERWATMRVLIDLAWASEDASVRARVRDLMSSVAASETEPVLRRQAEMWSRRIRA